MKPWAFIVCVGLLLAGCASGGLGKEDARLALYRSHAGAPVGSFHSFGRFDSWESLGTGTVAIWTRPGEAWLLELWGPCSDLPYSVAIGLTSHAGSVQAGLDEVVVRSPPPVSLPCRIRTIQPLDVTAIKRDEKAMREHTVQQLPSSDTPDH